MLVDFVGKRWARYLGRSRTFGGDFANQTEQELRSLDWHEALYNVRYKPWELDPNYKGPERT